MPGKRAPFTPPSILFRPRHNPPAINADGLWWRRRVLPPGPDGLLRCPFITIVPEGTDLIYGLREQIGRGAVAFRDAAAAQRTGTRIAAGWGASIRKQSVRREARQRSMRCCSTRSVATHAMTASKSAAVTAPIRSTLRRCASAAACSASLGLVAGSGGLRAAGSVCECKPVMTINTCQPAGPAYSAPEFSRLRLRRFMITTDMIPTATRANNPTASQALPPLDSDCTPSST
jgi:hypothetical protein